MHAAKRHNSYVHPCASYYTARQIYLVRSISCTDAKEYRGYVTSTKDWFLVFLDLERQYNG